jgi:hypothetical protein
MDCTRLLRVPGLNAAVAIATAAFSCSGPDVALVAPVTTPPRTVLFDPSRSASLGAVCVATGIETCFDAGDENCNGAFDEGCGLPDGVVQLIAAWQPPDADVELEVIDPGGELVSVGHVTTLGLSKDRNCPKEPDDCGGQNTEVVSLDAERVPEGRYLVTLRLKAVEPPSTAVTVRLGGHIDADSVVGSFSLSRTSPAVRLEIERIEPRAESRNPNP